MSLISKLSLCYLGPAKATPTALGYERDFLNSCKPWVPIRHPGIPGNLQAARMAALASVDTKYVMVLDHDDLVVPETLVRMLVHLHTNPEVVSVTCQEARFWGDELPTRLENLDSLNKPGIVSIDSMFTAPRVFHTCSMHRTENVKELLKYFSTVQYSNFDWAFRLAMANLGPIYRLPYLGYYWRQHEEQMTSRRTNGQRGIAVDDMVNKLAADGMLVVPPRRSL